MKKLLIAIETSLLISIIGLFLLIPILNLLIFDWLLEEKELEGKEC
jgi:hypothetical protein